METIETLVQNGVQVPEVINPQDLGWLGQALRDRYVVYERRIITVQPLYRGPIVGMDHYWRNAYYSHRGNKVLVYQGTPLQGIPTILTAGILSTRYRSTVALAPNTDFVFQYSEKRAVISQALGVRVGAIVVATAWWEQLDTKSSQYPDAALCTSHPDPESIRHITDKIPNLKGWEEYVYLPPEQVVGFYVVLFGQNHWNLITDFSLFELYR